MTFYNTITYYLLSGPMKHRMLGECRGISSSPITLSHGGVIQSRVLDEKLPPVLWGFAPACLESRFGAVWTLREVVLIQEMKMNPVWGVIRPDVMWQVWFYQILSRTGVHKFSVAVCCLLHIQTLALWLPIIHRELTQRPGFLTKALESLFEKFVF